MLSIKKQYLSSLCVICCVMAFSSGCSSSGGNGDKGSASSDDRTTSEASPAEAPTATAQPTSTPTPTQTRWDGPYGVTFDANDLTPFEDLEECITSHGNFLDILDLAFELTEEALNRGSLTDYGLVWLALEENLLENFSVINFLVDCENEYPRIFDGWYQDGLFPLIDDCKVISNFSSERATNKCLDSLDYATDKTYDMTDRLNAINDWATDIRPEVEAASN